ncbi:MAG: UDP-diphospho-muramoylpentapeptide beta-N- acetylglucosaminyltransferase [candidate division CPR2 bacterium GW2011_GWC1_41_48]|uniref:UDP-N-acetylglucosamine--N-acetylmuramyl-(pentapeptide) pyrophosphoryl-undecaprenol N-acetylglucosamine transferase n=1 Tax=candidate division CPR2 bacterium GW2011_GWC1_41_48 TaxID=1618344 RepID=A0A0G0Z9X9_UNCC2|nr:MAG: UDP-diphospho-muramoylpentapeptide beta-N- acetylglucosaminyltransferase [candidate division CPR2 bacterium GW2011_GWC2_39_35]KKR27892.1 MAG: UDP-diphospho-muramoylpentapeptide beta-N- acetylglucosaminyltransferase [candidate division CPR2 bacterium GW2011_GWD1_39_7]KKR29139.1 MAG: UDP-diphospho-muramoylpentapeptide beta-N- acetylglucosaminyltransferase [candidate division CPR2 bacterium GW2011_GWD2_39_7]KKS09853.1 MAG: UDP-diphospho-muramoylpentapeptide beta-N- acetylglucosaminyltransfe
METKVIPQLGLNYHFVSAGKFRRYHNNLLLNIVDPTTIFKNLIDFFKVIKGFFESRAIIKEYDPDLVFIKGGYVGLPIGFAAASLNYPIIIHESDSILGLANRILSRFASRIMVSYPENYYHDLPRAKVVYTGNPIRKEMLTGSLKEGREVFELNIKEPVLLIVGGSQGSHFINSLIAESLSELLKDFQIIHVCGDNDISWLLYLKSQLEDDLKNKYKVFSFLSNELRDAFAVSDLVIGRAGQNFISEASAIGKPMLLIPLGVSSSAHQFRNAQIVTRFGAAYTLTEDDLSRDVFIRQIKLIFEKPGELAFLAKKSKEFGKEDASESMAEVIMEYARLNNEEEEKEITKASRRKK